MKTILFNTEMVRAIQNEFPVRLKKLMDEKNVSKYKIAHLCGVTRSTVWRWIRGEREPKPKHYVYIADYFDVSVDYLMGRTEIRKMNTNLP